MSKLIHYLEAKRALSGDHVGIIEGWNKHCSGLQREGPGLAQTVIEHRTAKDHRGAVVLGGLEFGERHRVGHEDGGVSPGERRGQRHPLSMVAGRRRHHGHARRKLHDSVVRPADLERTGALEMLGFDGHRPANGPADGIGEASGGGPQYIAQPPTGCLDVVDRHGQRSHVIHLITELS